MSKKKKEEPAKKPNIETVKDKSLERLENQYEQAKLDGNTQLTKMLKAIINRIKTD